LAAVPALTAASCATACWIAPLRPIEATTTAAPASAMPKAISARAAPAVLVSNLRIPEPVPCRGAHNCGHPNDQHYGKEDVNHAN